MSKIHLAFVLDRRPQTLIYLSHFISKFVGVKMMKGNKENPIGQLDLEFEGFWPFHLLPSYLFYQKNRENLQFLDFDYYGTNSVNNITKVFESLAGQHSWVLIPWGREQAAEMFAFVTQDESLLKVFLASFAVFEPGNRASGLVDCSYDSRKSLVVSQYCFTSRTNPNFCGCLFSHNDIVKVLWKLQPYGVPLYALKFQETASPSKISGGLAGADLKAAGVYRNGMSRELIQLTTLELARKILKDWGTAIVFPGTDDLNSLKTVFERKDFKIDSAFDFLPTVTKLVDWVYLPENGYSTTQMYHTLAVRNPSLQNVESLGFDLVFSYF